MVSEISKLDFGLRPSQLLIGVDGEVNSEEFIRRAKLDQKAVDSWFDPVRYFCRDGELITIRGRTYAVNSQWTGKLFQEAMLRFKRDYNNLNIEFSPTREGKTNGIENNRLSAKTTAVYKSKGEPIYHSLDLNGKNYLKLSLRQAIRQTVKFMLNNGVSSQELNKHDFDLRPRQLLLSVNGEVKHEEFLRLIEIEREKNGFQFDPQRRFMVKDNELIKLNGKTFAVNGEWTQWKFKSAMNQFKKEFPNLNIHFRSLGSVKSPLNGSNVVKINERSTQKKLQSNQGDDLESNNEYNFGISMRKTILQIVRFFIDNGVDPIELAEENFGLNPPYLIFEVDGEVNSNEFIKLAKNKLLKLNRTFDPDRYFCRDNQLIKKNGRTYAVNGEWKKPIYINAMSKFKKKYSDLYKVFYLKNSGKTELDVKSDSQYIKDVRRYLFDIKLDNHKISNLPQELAILETLRYLLIKGVDPYDFMEGNYNLRYSKKFLIGVSGEVNSEEFLRLAKLGQQRIGQIFDPKFYFCDDNELVRVNGQTYAIYNQWTGNIFVRVMARIRKDYKGFNINFTPVGHWI